MLYPSYGFVQAECRYRCPATGKGVTSWRQRREIMASKNLMDMSDINPAKEIAKAEARKAADMKLAAQMPHYGSHPKNFT